MNELSSLGLILLMALLTGQLAKTVKLPEVTGYILAGVMLGPSVLSWQHATRRALIRHLPLGEASALGGVLRCRAVGHHNSPLDQLFDIADVA